MSDRPAASRPRHPSAGNLGERPTLVTPSGSASGGSTLAYPTGAEFDPTAVHFGPGLTDDALERLVGSGEGKRVLELGCGDGGNAIALARQGARVIVVDSSASRLAVARNNAEAHDVRIEFHHGDLADLAFVRADQIDLCLSVYSLAEVADVSRVFRQVHRVLRPEALFVISLPHPLAMMCELDPSGEGVRLRRSAFDESRVDVPGSASPIQAHRMTDIFTALGRSNFRVDALLEPAVDAGADSAYASELNDWIPSTVIYRGRKQGI
ncbi:MAG: class I SAM-dependent methyltransferase [Acidimicrobiales bacterium]